MKKVLPIFLLGCSLLTAYEERPGAEEYNIRTMNIFKAIQRMTKADQVERLKGATDQEIFEFCEKNNFKVEDIKDVLHR